MPRNADSHLNYCRSMVRDFLEILPGGKSREGSAEPQSGNHLQAVLSHLIDLANMSQKFMLPAGGRLLDDPELRALRDDERLSLPFPCIALEYRFDGDAEEGKTKSSKRIVFAREREEFIAISIACWHDSLKRWGPLPEVAIPRTGYLDRQNSPNGIPAVAIQKSPMLIDEGDFMGEVRALLGMLGALSCTNVKTELSHPRHSGKRVKSALPFDSYHLLYIDTKTSAGQSANVGGAHRSPREHLRRGHIRVYETGLRTWVNSTVVNAGRSKGKVRKDYVVS